MLQRKKKLVPERVALSVNEGLLIGDDVGMADRGQDAHFVKRVLLFLFVQVAESNFFECVLGVVLNSLNLVDYGIRSFA